MPQRFTFISHIDPKSNTCVQYLVLLYVEMCVMEPKWTNAKCAAAIKKASPDGEAGKIREML
jgi:hypothetical protein